MERGYFGEVFSVGVGSVDSEKEGRGEYNFESCVLFRWMDGSVIRIRNIARLGWWGRCCFSFGCGEC